MARKQMTPAQKARARQQREEKAKALFDQLQDRGQAFIDSARYQSYLRAARHFHHYSANNQFLIWWQAPDATAVNSYKRWQELGRQVVKGAKAIRILAPRPVRYTREEERDDRTEEVEYAYTRFVSVPIFAYEQTEPMEDFKSAPWEPMRFPTLTEDVGGRHFEALAGSLRGTGIPVSEEATPTGIGGYYMPANHSITIGTDHPPLHRLHVLIHEAAHAMHYAIDKADAKGSTSAYREIVAESAAYIVAEAVGLDVGAHSEQYVGVHARIEPEAMEKALPMIQRISHTLIDALENALAAGDTSPAPAEPVAA